MAQPKDTCSRGIGSWRWLSASNIAALFRSLRHTVMDPQRFSVLPVARFAGRNALVRRPQEITHFSFDETHTLCHDHSSLKSYYTPELDKSLSRGFENFVKHDDGVDEHLDGLLSAIERLERSTGQKVKADLVTWRGMITKFMTLPFNTRDGFEMNAVKFQDTIFIEENHSYKQSTRGPQDRLGEVMSFWGYKFEALSTIPGNWDDCSRETIESRDDEIVSNEAQFCSIVKTGFADVRVVIGGEVDAVWNSNPPTNPANPPIYVELKTSRAPATQRDDIAFEHKLLRFWSQSFLLGVAKIIVGFRDNDGVLRSLQTFETREIPGIAKRSGRGLWDGKLCIDFTTSLVEWIKETVGGEEEGAVWRIRCRPNGGVVEVVRTEEKTFLSEGFVEWRKEMGARGGGDDGCEGVKGG